MAQIAFPRTYQSILTSSQIEYMMEWMYSEESLERQMLRESHLYYIAYSDDRQALGYVSIRPDGEHLFHLEKIYVLPQYQHLKVGGALFRYALARVKDMHPEPCAVELNVNRNNPALGFYEHMGMHIDREGDFDIGNGYYMNDYIMRIEL